MSEVLSNRDEDARLQVATASWEKGEVITGSIEELKEQIPALCGGDKNKDRECNDSHNGKIVSIFDYADKSGILKPIPQEEKDRILENARKSMVYSEEVVKELKKARHPDIQAIVEKINAEKVKQEQQEVLERKQNGIWAKIKGLFTVDFIA